MSYVVDTHALLWYVTSDERLSRRVEKILDEAHHIIIVPSIVLVEAIDILEKGKVSYQIEIFLSALKSSEHYTLAPVTWEIVELYRKLNAVLDIHDRLIVATAQYWNASILTKDKEIAQYYGERVVW